MRLRRSVVALALPVLACGSPTETPLQLPIAVAFDVASDNWVELADKPLATMDHRGLIAFDGVFYTVGGMLAGQTVTNGIHAFRPE
jgi:hypothetical protein